MALLTQAKLNYVTKIFVTFMPPLLLLLIGPLTISGLVLSDDSAANQLECYQQNITSLGSDCRLLEVYDQSELDKLSVSDKIDLAEYCACKLANLDWATAYDHASTRFLERKVFALVNNETSQNHYPDYLWSDIDVIVNGISIYVSTKDYFDKRRKDASWGAVPAAQVDKDPVMRQVRFTCIKIAQDKMNLYQYLENLERINPIVFFKMLNINDYTNNIYQASKTCKMFLNHRLHDFKLRPDNRDFYAVDKLSLKESEMASYNMIASNDIDVDLKDSSIWLVNCSLWQHELLSLSALELECPMLISGELPVDWLEQHRRPSERAFMALKCGCQLLLHNSTWSEIIKDQNIDVMSKTLTQYLNHHRLPEWRDAPMYSVYAWFTEMMEKFQKNKNIAIKEIVKFRRSDSETSSTNDEENAVKLLRQGCKRIMYVRESTASHSRREPNDIKLIRYLDNLRFISQDPLFVFHLTLQDSNLFKLHALSKMCEPFVAFFD